MAPGFGVGFFLIGLLLIAHVDDRQVDRGAGLTTCRSSGLHLRLGHVCLGPRSSAMMSVGCDTTPPSAIIGTMGALAPPIPARARSTASSTRTRTCHSQPTSSRPHTGRRHERRGGGEAPIRKSCSVAILAAISPMERTIDCGHHLKRLAHLHGPYRQYFRGLRASA